MIRIIDTYSQIESLFDKGTFNLEKWEIYINSIYDKSAEIFRVDLQDCLDSGSYTYEKDILPIINAVYKHSALEALHTSFHKVTTGLNEKIRDCFDCELDIDIVLYIGLCNAAGWVTNIHGKDVILLGIEKILELNWQDEDAMYGLIYHELGHVYHKQYGFFDQYSEDNRQRFVWQLFTEGIAMYFEQAMLDDFNYFHQDKNGWKEWCDIHFKQILDDFYADLPTMTSSNQKYFGDWVNYCGRGDVGYYLGTKFVQHLSSKYGFEQLTKMRIEDVYQEFNNLVKEKKKVAFICVHNSCRSQIAEALGKHLASDVFESYSAGTETKPQINQDAVRIIKELYGIDMEKTQYSKLISDIPNPDIAISMGCNVGCPFIGRAFDDNWGLEDPTGKTDEDFKQIIAEIERNILKLKQELQ